jgi:hypothetical protein
MRIKRFDVSVECFIWLLSPERKHYAVTQNGLPEDAELVRISVDPYESAPSVVSLYFTSMEFPDLPSGALLPREKIQITRYYDADKETP